MSDKELLVKRFRSLVTGSSIPLLDERITAENIAEDLYGFDLDCDYPFNWEEMSDVKQALFIIDNSQVCRDWVRQHYIID